MMNLIKFTVFIQALALIVSLPALLFAGLTIDGFIAIQGIMLVCCLILPILSEAFTKWMD